ncbi:hypothetical protein [Ascidiimonas sp. W6]|uniref:hypothetical protein n=1 Tax=Ascidiimonas meishanensis TaxID=3128903 RepID=UPI0030ECCBD4
MKNFLIHISLFILLFIGVTTLLLYGTNWLIAKKASFTFDEDIKYLVVGHSHPQCAINDSLIPELKNIANAGEAYFYNYVKLKKVLAQNPQLTTIFIEFSNNHIDTLMNRWTWGDMYIVRYSNLTPFISAEDKKLILKHNLIGYQKTLSPSLKGNLIRIAKNDYDLTDEIGGYRNLKRNIIDSLLNNLGRKPLEAVKTDYPISNYSIQYLQKMIAECHKYGKEVILMRSPQHPKLEIRLNEAHFQRIRTQYFADLVFLDFDNFPLTKESFGDLEHLNYKGASTFSLWFKDLLDQGLLEEKDKISFVKNRYPN